MLLYKKEVYISILSMKKIFALLLLCVHMCNLSGYLLTQFFIQQNDSHLVARLDSDSYAEKSLVMIKIPLHLPYSSESSSFVRVNGQIELHGTWYNYVKRRVLRDSLVLMCLPNLEKGKLMTAAAELNRQNEGSLSSKNHEPLVKKSKTIDEYNINTTFSFYLKLSDTASSHNCLSFRLLPCPALALNSEPPEASKGC